MQQTLCLLCCKTRDSFDGFKRYLGNLILLHCLAGADMPVVITLLNSVRITKLTPSKAENCDQRCPHSRMSWSPMSQISLMSEHCCIIYSALRTNLSHVLVDMLEPYLTARKMQQCVSRKASRVIFLCSTQAMPSVRKASC